MRQELLNAIDKFQPISLAEMDEVKLLNRTDTKFVFTVAELAQLLTESAGDYKVLTIKDKRFSNYKTLYFDTPDYDFFTRHHNGKENRFKVRMRKYLESDLCFIEVKNKKKGRTVKSRIKIPDFEEVFGEKNQGFVDKVLGQPTTLIPAIWNSFSRITLVNQELKERLTIDTMLSFERGDTEKVLSEIVIAEVKQENVSRNTPLVSKFKERQIRPSGMSKYCIGCVLLDKDLKYNNFKEKILMIEKLSA
jgi:hypothetical protein